MEAKVPYMGKVKNCRSKPLCVHIPTNVLLDAVLEAQDRALAAVVGLELDFKQLELFWLTYNFEFRQQIERYVKENANIEA